MLQSYVVLTASNTHLYAQSCLLSKHMMCAAIHTLAMRVTDVCHQHPCRQNFIEVLLLAGSDCLECVADVV